MAQQHGTCVAVDEKALLIVGPSGSGKSSLALQLMALGASLVADDRVDLVKAPDGIIASCPKNISGLIEARGIGVLNASITTNAILKYVVDLSQTETDRVPATRHFTVLGESVPLLYKVDGIHFAASLWQLLCNGWSTR